MRSTNDLDRAFEHGMDALRRAVLAALSPHLSIQLSPRLSLDPVLQPAGHVLLSETATPTDTPAPVPSATRTARRRPRSTGPSASG